MFIYGVFLNKDFSTRNNGFMLSKNVRFKEFIYVVLIGIFY